MRKLKGAGAFTQVKEQWPVSRSEELEENQRLNPKSQSLCEACERMHGYH